MSKLIKKRIAVVGAGIYGITIALKLAKSKHFSVTLFEKNSDIMMAASMVNQNRLHKGYHYPRSDSTVTASLESQREFIATYRPAILTSSENYYAISNHDSLTSAHQFEAFCAKHALPLKPTTHPLINSDHIEQIYRVQERLIDPFKLKEICWQRLKSSNISVKTSTLAKVKMLADFDHIIVTAYAEINNALIDSPSYQKEYQFEVCEKIAVQLPKQFNNQSLVIMDGPFMCVDPFGETGLHLMGNVVHAIHSTNVGTYPKIPARIKPFLNTGLQKTPSISKFSKFIESGSLFIPRMRQAKYHGSMFTVRTVLPNKDKTDERPTIVKQLNSRITTVYSGKVSNCVQAAEQVWENLKQ